ncbi:MAG TPA: class I SAM-dependent methyltransferase [Propionibacteriaceae bacterium]
MGWWGERVLPRAIDRMLDNDEVNAYRRTVCAGLSGTVLEIGFGSGLNVAFYPTAVERVLAVEPSDLAWELSASRRAAYDAPVERTGLDGQRLELGDGTVDHVLSTFTLCTIPEVGVALAEVRRVLRPGGELHFLEHGQAPEASVVRWQRRINVVQRRVAGGCHLDRPIDALVTGAGLDLVALQSEYAAGLRPFAYVYCGTAANR